MTLQKQSERKGGAIGYSLL